MNPPTTEPNRPSVMTQKGAEDLLRFHSPSKLQKLERCFSMADHDGDGHLNPTELQYWLEKHNRPVKHSEVLQIMQVADLDKDGKLSFPEFVKFCRMVRLEKVGPAKEEDEVYFDCVDHSFSSGDNNDHPQDHDKCKTHGSVKAKAQYFEDQINLAERRVVDGEERAREYAKRLQEVKSSVGFDWEDFCSRIHHPSREGVHGEESHGPRNQKVKTVRYRTELYIPPNGLSAQNTLEHSQSGDAGPEFANPDSSRKRSSALVGHKRAVYEEAWQAKHKTNVSGQPRQERHSVIPPFDKAFFETTHRRNRPKRHSRLDEMLEALKPLPMDKAAFELVHHQDLTNNETRKQGNVGRANVELENRKKSLIEELEKLSEEPLYEMPQQGMSKEQRQKRHSIEERREHLFDDLERLYAQDSFEIQI